MKGVVFNEFLGMIEEKFGAEMVENLIDKTNPESGASYTSVGTYDHKEIINYVVALADESKLPVPALVKTFGKYLFHSFTQRHNAMISRYTHGFDLLDDIHDHIHVEVAKLYNNAELPHFATNRDGNTLEMIYTSERKMSDLAEGLIEETMIHFNHQSTIEKELLDLDGSKVKFIIKITD